MSLPHARRQDAASLRFHFVQQSEPAKSWATVGDFNEIDCLHIYHGIPVTEADHVLSEIKPYYEAWRDTMGAYGSAETRAGITAVVKKQSTLKAKQKSMGSRLVL